LEGADLEARVVGAGVYGEAERGGEVLLVSQHDVHLPRERTIHFLGALLTANAAPQRFAVIEVIRDDRAAGLGGAHGCVGALGGGVGDGGEEAAGVKPADAIDGKQPLPVDRAGSELARRGMAAIVTALRRAHAVTPLGEVQAISRIAANAVVGDPA